MLNPVNQKKGSVPWLERRKEGAPNAYGYGAQ